MVLFKKQKKRLQDFLNKHDDNILVSTLTQFAVGLGLVATFLIIFLIAAIPLSLITELIGPGWTIGGAIIALIVWFVGFMTCTDLQTRKIP